MKTYPLVVIGAGSAGLTIAVGAAKAGKKVLLIERGLFGGDCTNYGCIPSKSLIASARIAHAIEHAERFGIQTAQGFEAHGALKRAQSIVERVRTHEDAGALAKLGIDTLAGEAHFIARHVLEVKMPSGITERVQGKKIVIATGSSPRIPAIDGLQGTPYLTNETIFSLPKIPNSLTILGGGPIGCELAQAFQRLGSKVRLIQKHPALLMKEEPLAQELIAKTLSNEGVYLHLCTILKEVKYSKDRFHLTLFDLTSSKKEEVATDALLIATGRIPNTHTLNLDSAHVHHFEKGIPVDRFGRTYQKHIFAVGDVLGGPFFTHLAHHQARAVLTSLLLPFPFLKRLPRDPIPRATFTDPEIAAVGLSSKKAQQLYSAQSVLTLTVLLQEVDRAITESREEGFITFVVKKWTSSILGATIVGPRASELLPLISLAIRERVPLRKLASLITPYPTYAQSVEQAANMWLKTFLRRFLKS